MQQFDPVIGLAMALIFVIFGGYGLYLDRRLRQLDRRAEEREAANPPPTAP
jgi:hypothetical protein